MRCITFRVVHPIYQLQQKRGGEQRTAEVVGKNFFAAASWITVSTGSGPSNGEVEGVLFGHEGGAAFWPWSSWWADGSISFKEAITHAHCTKQNMLTSSPWKPLLLVL